MQARMPDLSAKPIVCLCTSKREVGALVEGAARLSGKSDFVLLLDSNERVERRILPAFVNARVRFSENAARAKSMQMEVLLLVCGTMNIGNAIRECGARDSSEFLVVATSNSLLGRFAKANAVRITKKLNPAFDASAAADVALTELSSE